MKEDIVRDASEQKLTHQLLTSCEPVRIGIDLAKGFKPALANYQAQDLGEWTRRAMQDGVPMEIKSFAEGWLKRATGHAAFIYCQ